MQTTKNDAKQYLVTRITELLDTATVKSITILHLVLLAKHKTVYELEKFKRYALHLHYTIINHHKMSTKQKCKLIKSLNKDNLIFFDSAVLKLVLEKDENNSNPIFKQTFNIKMCAPTSFKTFVIDFLDAIPLFFEKGRFDQTAILLHRLCSILVQNNERFNIDSSKEDMILNAVFKYLPKVKSEFCNYIHEQSSEYILPILQKVCQKFNISTKTYSILKKDSLISYIDYLVNGFAFKQSDILCDESLCKYLENIKDQNNLHSLGEQEELYNKSKEKFEEAFARHNQNYVPCTTVNIPECPTLQPDDRDMLPQSAKRQKLDNYISR